MQANGRFVQKLYERPLPPGIDYYLFFGHGGRYSLMRSANHDGTVTMASQLRPAAQAEARMVYGFDEGHTSILSSPQVFKQYVAVLDAVERKGIDGHPVHNGTLRLAFSYEQPDSAPQTEPLLVLTPTDAAREKIVLPLSARDSDRELGPFPPGDYEASMLAYAFATTPRKIPITIAAGKVPDLRFLLTPMGVLSGYIGADVKPIDNPAGSYRPPHRDIVLESITLSNGKETRTLVPDKGLKDRTIETYLADEDYSFQSFFSFVGLRQGDYELTIKVAGYQAHRQTYHVIPGQYGYVKPIDLTPLKN